jgi:glycosyltransferase involved in cell wall biosynthesis
MLDVSVIVPVRNAEHFVDECLAAIVRAAPCEIIVVDGCSTDHTLEIARRYPVKVLSDDRRGVAAARMMGAQAATSAQIALMDVDIILPDGALAQLLDEYKRDQYAALQAGLHSVAGPGYWGQALVYHHNHGRSKNWPGVMATIMDREMLLRHGFDLSFKSGEDIELRWRLQRAQVKLGVSRRTIVEHRFEDTYDCARGQFTADGYGLGRMVHKYGWRAAPLLGIPLAGCVRGSLLCLMHGQPKWIPYYLTYLAYNYSSMVRGLFERNKQPISLRRIESSGKRDLYEEHAARF